MFVMNNIITISDFIAICKDINKNNDKNNDFYKCLEELKTKLSIFYNGIMDIKFNKSEYNILPSIYSLDFSQIANAEIERIKFNI